MRDLGLRPYGMLGLTRMGAAGAAASGLNPFIFDLGASTFTAAMAKRTSPGPFETAPIYQGDWDGTGTPDEVTFSRGSQLGNPTYFYYSNIDPYQGSVVFWITPEWDGDDGIRHGIFDSGGANSPTIEKKADDLLYLLQGGNNVTVDISAWTAGTTYCVCGSWMINPIDGTNYLRLSVDDAHTFAGTSAPTIEAPAAVSRIGLLNTVLSASAIIEGLTVYRRVLFDGTYGKDVGNGDELNLIYAAGSGVDPTTITGSNDVCACQPTDSTAGAYATGTGEMWSHPLSSSIVDDTHMSQGMMPGGDWAVGFDGDASVIMVSDNATIQDLADDILSIDIWVLANSRGQNNNGRAIAKTNAGASGGWQLLYVAENTFRFQVFCATSDSVCAGTLPTDGKWHLVTCYWDDAGGANRKTRMAVDGIWNDFGGLGVGAIETDVGQDLSIGALNNGVREWDGLIAWAEISDNDRHGGATGTDFQNSLPITPYDDGNTIESWDLNDGSGGTAAANINSPANDGTITSGTWENIWDREGTPVELKALQFYAENDGIDFGSGANIDDLPSADCTIEFIVRVDETPDANTVILSKTSGTAEGWRIYFTATGFSCVIVHADTNIVLPFVMTADGVFHHYAIDFDFGTLTARGFIDGIFEATRTAVGAYQSDAAEDCLVNARNAIGTLDTSFVIGPIRLSDSRRYTGVSFAPPDMANWPANDANAQLITTMRDGTGTTVTDYSGNGYNGTVTFGATTRWLNTTDGEMMEPGNRMFPHSMVIGSDAADDGIVIGTAPTNPSDSVMLPRVSCGQAGRAWIIIDYNGTEFKLPRFHDTHDGAGNSATLINSDGSFTQQLVGWELYNITDGSSTTITAVSGDGTTITGVLAGGTDNDWDAADEYIIRPPSNGNYCDHPIATYAIWVLRTAAAAVDLKVKNEAGEGVIQIHQMEVQESGLTNGDHETLNGGFPGAAELITTWLNNGLDAGDTQPEAAIIHSGAQSLRWNTGASEEGMIDTWASAIGVGQFVCSSAWVYGDGTAPMVVRSSGAVACPLQYDPAARELVSSVDAVWQLVTGVYRNASGYTFQLHARSGAAGSRYTDDAYAILMDDISITVTPASQANSLEGTGIRVDGLDTLTQPIPVGYLRAQEGHIRFPWTPRHSDSDALLFGGTNPYPFWLQGDGNNYIFARFSLAGWLQMRFRVNGVNTNASWNSAGALVPGVRYVIDVIYGPGFARLYVDGVLRITIAPVFPFTAVPATAYWGTSSAGDEQSDAVIG